MQSRLLAGALCVLAVAAHGSGCVPAQITHYVDASAPASCPPEIPRGSLDCPFQTISDASWVAQPNEVVRIRGDGRVYDEMLRPFRTGTSPSAMIVYEGYGTQRPVIVNLGGGIQPRDCIVLDNHRYIAVRNVICDGGASTASGFKSFIQLYASSYNEVSNCEYRGAVGTMTNTMVELTGDYANSVYTTYNKLIGLKIRHSSVQYPSNGVVFHRQSHHNLLENSDIVVSAFHIAVSLFSSYNVVRGNSISNTVRTGLALASPPAGGTPYDTAERNVVEGNRIFGTSSTGNSIQLQAQHTIIRHNQVHNGNHPISIGRGMASHEARYLRRNRIYHNVFYKNSVVSPNGAVEISIPCDAVEFGNTQDNRFVNNAFFRNNLSGGRQLWIDMGFSSTPANCYVTSSPPRIYGPNQTALRNNSFRLDSSSPGGQALFFVFDYGQPLYPMDRTLAQVEAAYPTYFQNNREDDPAFVAPDTDPPNFHLLSTSPLIDRGAFLTHVDAVVGGSGQAFALEDVGFFSDGHGLGLGDTIQFEGGTTTIITAIDYSTRQITVTSSQPPTVTVGSGVSLPWTGSVPDIGAYEY